ncbi:hypothetical protein PENTCL1PPCAC_17068, partial [Pristionchus entomophagus]
RAMITTKVTVSESKECPSPPRFFSLRSHRLIICILLLVANYFGYANVMAMSTAVVCMVNSTLTVDSFNQSASSGTCVIRSDELDDDEFAIPGTMDWNA